MIIFTAWLLTVVTVLIVVTAVCLHAAINLGMTALYFLVVWLVICLVLSITPVIHKEK